MLREECFQFQMCKNNDLKFAVLERVHHTIRDKLYKYFKYKNNNIYIYIDVLTNFFQGLQ